MSCPRSRVASVSLLSVLALMLAAQTTFAWPERLDIQGDSLPAGAIARLGTSRLRPGSSDVSFAFSPDGKILATGEEKVRFWEVSSGKEIRCITMPGYVYHIRSIAFSPDGKLFAANGDDFFIVSHPPFDQTTIYIGEVSTGKILHQLKAEGLGFEGIRFSADSKRVAASTTLWPEVHVWDPATGKPVQHFSDVTSWSFSPDGKSIALGQNDGRIALHDLIKDREPLYFSGHQSAVLSLAFSPDGKQLASGGGYSKEKKYVEKPEIDRTIRFWDVASGKESHKIEAGEHDVAELVFSPDGRYLLAKTSRGGDPRSAEHPASPGTSLWDMTTRKRHEQFSEGKRETNVYVFSPDGKSLIRSSRDGLHAWEIATKKETRHWGPPARSGAAITYSPDGTLLASGGSFLYLWDMRTGKELHQNPGHRTDVRSLAFSPNGKRLASVDSAGALYLWETMTGKPLLAPEGDGTQAVLLVTFAREGQTLIAVGRNGEVRVWDSTTGKVQSSFRVGVEDALSATASDDERISWLSGTPPSDWGDTDRLTCSRDGKTLAVAAADNTIHLWDVTTGKERRQLKGQKETISHLTFAPDGRTLAAQVTKEITCLWDVESGKEIRRFTGEIVAFSREGRLFAWADKENIYLWDLAVDKELHRWPVVGKGGTTSLAFSGDGKMIAAGGDTMACLWDVSSGQERRRFGGTLEEMNGVHLDTTPDGRLFARYSLDPRHGSVATLGLDTGRRIDLLHPHGGDSLFFAPDGLSYAHEGQNLVIRAINTGKTLLKVPEPHRGHTSVLAYSFDGQLLASGGSDGTILIWDMAPFSPKRMPKAYTFTTAELDDLWTKLLPRGEYRDDREAYHTLLGTPELTIPYLRERIRRLPVPDAKQVASWIANLDNENFEERKKAQEELIRYGKLVAPALHKTLAKKPSAELRVRGEELLAPDGGCGKLPPDWQRAAESIRLLEQLNTSESRRALEELSQAAAGSWVAVEAKSALDRLGNAKK